MTFKLEQHLRELGVMPADTFDELSEPASDDQHLSKDCFNDPRDPFTGEVPF